jgi:hypothetical protein
MLSLEVVTRPLDLARRASGDTRRCDSGDTTDSGDWDERCDLRDTSLAWSARAASGDVGVGDMGVGDTEVEVGALAVSLPPIETDRTLRRAVGEARSPTRSRSATPEGEVDCCCPREAPVGDMTVARREGASLPRPTRAPCCDVVRPYAVS